MFAIVALTVTSGVVGASVLKIKENKKKKEKPWTYYAEKTGAYKRLNMYRGTRESSKSLIRRDMLLSSSYERGKEALLKIQQEKIAPFLVDSREQQFSELSSVVGGENEISEAEKEINRGLKTLSVSLAFATAGTLFYPPLALLSLPGLLQRIIPLIRRGYREFREDRRFTMSTLDAIAVPAILLTGNYLVASLAVTFIYLAEKLKIKTQERSEKSLTNIFDLHSNFVWVLRDETEIEIPIDQLEIGDTIVINAGQTVPVDGLITDGYALIDQRTLTGEAQPVEKERDAQVFASTLVIEGRICVYVEKAGTDTMAAQIADILNNTTDFKSGVQSKGEIIGDQAASGLLGLGLLALPVVGPAGALTILNAPIINTLRMAAPLSVLNFLQIAAKQGILIKDGRALELLGTVDTIVFDKTGTLTQEVPHVGAIHSCSDLNENELLRLAAAAEQKQEHPIARAILQEASDRQLTLPQVTHAKYEVGYGLKVTIDDKLIFVGSKRFMEMTNIAIPTDIVLQQERCNQQGYSLVYIAIDHELAGAIELHPTIRPEARQVIQELRERNLDIFIISGDHEEPTRQLANQLGIEHYFAETLPENKADHVRELQKQGRNVCFIGDGINDSIALKTANVSISLRGASMIAMDTAGIILMDETLNRLVDLFDLAQNLKANMQTNFAITFIPGIICVTGAFFLHFGLLSAMLLYQAGMLAGITNAMLPLIKHRQSSTLPDDI